MRCLFLFISLSLATACSASLDFGDSDRFEIDDAGPRAVMRDAQIPRDMALPDPEDMGTEMADADEPDMDPSIEDAGTQASDTGIEMDASASIDIGPLDAQTGRDSGERFDSNTEAPDQALDQTVDSDLGADSSNNGPPRKDPIREND